MPPADPPRRWRSSVTAMETDTLAELRPLVVGDAVLCRRLLAAPDRGAFVAEVVALAHERGIAVSSADVVAALDAAMRRRRDRWV